MSKANLAYAKLTATPTSTAWSQAYNAGNLFACLSLTIESQEDHESLQSLGKDLFNNLEAEFFTLEDKNLATIKEAIAKSLKHIPKEITVNFCLAFFKNNLLYLFLAGRGRVIMKRGAKLGVLLEQKEEATTEISTASGLLQNSDTVILETSQFAKNVSEKNLAEALQLELPNDIAEALSLHMHENADGDQAAIIIAFHGAAIHEVNKNLEDEEEPEELLAEEPIMPEKKRIHLPSFDFIAKLLAKSKLPFQTNKRQINFKLNHRKKIFLSVTLIIVVLLTVSIVLTKQKQEATKTQTTFQAIYQPASKDYEDGLSLKTLNPSLSHDDFLKAEKLIKDGQNQLPKDSQEAKQVADLLAKIEAELGSTPDLSNAVPTKETAVGDNDLLAVAKANKDNIGVSQDETNVYYITTTAVMAINKANGQKKELIKNNSAWQQAVAITPYLGNLYVLDQKDGVLKYVKTAGDYTKSNYFSSSPDLTKAVSMAIDSSVWMLFSDGTIKKFTKGQTDTFTVKNLTTPFKNPTKIYTDKDINNVYILDNGNSRIVKLAQDGSFQTEYKAAVLQNAKDFEVLEKDKKILILSNDKIWEITL